MPTNVMTMLQSLSKAEIVKLLAAKEKIERLQARRDELQKELKQVEADLSRVLGEPLSAGGKGRTVRKAGRKKTGKKTGVAAAARGKAVRATRKTSKRAQVKRGRKGKGRAATGKAAGGRKRMTLEDLVYDLIAKRGEAMPFQELLATITGKKLFATRSTNFDNVLRRTLSTSKRVKRVGRGIYGI